MLLTEWNWDDALEVRYKEGREEGHEEGLEESRIQIARKMKTAGRPLSEITEFTGLSPEAIEQIE